MLRSIEFSCEETYPASGENLTDLKKINFLFGHNGFGKNTSFRAIQDPASRTGYPALGGIAGHGEWEYPCISALRNRQVMLRGGDNAA